MKSGGWIWLVVLGMLLLVETGRYELMTLRLIRCVVWLLVVICGRLLDDNLWVVACGRIAICWLVGSIR